MKYQHLFRIEGKVLICLDCQTKTKFMVHIVLCVSKVQ